MPSRYAAALLLIGAVPFAWALSCNETELDRVAGTIIFFGGSPVEPTTEQGLKKKCDDFQTSIQYANSHNDQCVQGLAKGMVKLLLEGATNDSGPRCTDVEGRNRYLNLVPCFVKHGKEINKCNKVLAGILESATSKPKKNRVPLSCCYMGEYEKCVRNAAKKCSPDHDQYAKEIIDNYAGDLLSTICVRWKAGSKECKGLPKISPATNPKYQTLLPPLIEVLASLNN